MEVYPFVFFEGAGGGGAGGGGEGEKEVLETNCDVIVLKSPAT